MRKSKKNKFGLNEFEERFLNFYQNNGFNATQAYMSCKPNVSNPTARNEGGLLIKREHVAQDLQRRMEIERQREEIKKGDIVAKLKTLMFECVNDADRTNLLKTIDILNKMAGFYQQKIDITSKDEKINITLNLGEDEKETE